MAAKDAVITLFEGGGTPGLLITGTSIAAADTFSVDTWSLGLQWLPRTAVCIVTRSAGTTNAIDVDVDVSANGTTYVATDINNITAKDTHTMHPAAGAADDAGRIAWRYWRISVVDEGTGNTLSIALLLSE